MMPSLTIEISYHSYNRILRLFMNFVDAGQWVKKHLNNLPPDIR